MGETGEIGGVISFPTSSGVSNVGWVSCSGSSVGSPSGSSYLIFELVSSSSNDAPGTASSVESSSKRRSSLGSSKHWSEMVLTSVPENGQVVMTEWCILRDLKFRNALQNKTGLNISLPRGWSENLCVGECGDNSPVDG